MIYVISIIQGIAICILGFSQIRTTETMKAQRGMITEMTITLQEMSKVDTAQSKAIDKFREGFEAINMVNEKQTVFLLALEETDGKLFEAISR